ncbi:MAG: glycosyltransferase family 2 protein [Leptolyngbyaceae cyanobacterium]
MAVVRPQKLYVVADGPREGITEEADNCLRTRQLIEKIDWDCHVSKNYSDSNLGCKKRVSSGLDWVFSEVESAIILEDDCLPDLSFFQFCQELLNHYRHDSRVMAISGDNFQFGKNQTPYSYYFSRYPHCWGWATWKRAWKHYDIEMKLWPEIREGRWLRKILSNSSEVRYRTRIFQQVFDNQIDSWAYAWGFANFIQNGLTILPKVNLVSNIGFAEDATHTQNAQSKFANMKTEAMCFPLQHPPFVARHTTADDYTWQTMYSLPARAKRRITKLLTSRFVG